MHFDSVFTIIQASEPAGVDVLINTATDLKPHRNERETACLLQNGFTITGP